MRRNLIAILLVVNGLLAASLFWQSSSPNTAEAQTRRPGEYLLIDGEASGASQGIVYVLDVANGELGAIAADSRDKLQAMPKIDLNRIFDAALNQAAPPAEEGRTGRRRSN